MPRCQRTFRRLARPSGTDIPGAWVCPFCEEQEAYEAVMSPDLRQYALSCVYACRQTFRVADDGLATGLYTGLFPECVFEWDERRCDIYLQRGSDPFQLRLQIGHEVFHRVCSAGAVYHWTHEMLACLFSVWQLTAAGLTDYAQQTDREYTREAECLSLSALLSLNLSKPPYPQGTYARAYTTGKALAAVTSREALCCLVACLDQTGNPDLRQWINSLRLDEAQAVRQVMNLEP